MRAIRVGLAGLTLLLAVAAPLCGWWVATESADVWPVRNTLQYAAFTQWWRLVGAPPAPAAESDPRLTTLVAILVTNARGEPVPGARVLLTRWDGSGYAARAGPDGRAQILGVSTGRYAVVGNAPGYAPSVFPDLTLRPSPTGSGAVPAFAIVPLLLRDEEAARVPAGRVAPLVGEPESVRSAYPVSAEAVRRRLHSPGGGTSALLYTPAGLRPGERAPLLLTAYPGPADEWEGASVPLAAAGYAVLAYAPPYSFTPESSVAEMRSLLAAAQRGALPGVDGSRIAVLAGSYSGLHALRVLQEEHGNTALKAAVLMGAPTDLFDMRRRLEERSFVPPFGLDQALVALGFPDREAVRYWRYSGAYHVRRGMPPTLLVHSRQDDVVPYQQSELLARMLDEEGVTHEMHLLEGGSHYLLSAERDAGEIYELTVGFLRKHLG